MRQTAYLARFAQLAAERPLPDWRGYLRWTLLRLSSDKLHAPYESAHFDFFERTLTGKQEVAPRSKRLDPRNRFP